MSATVIIDYGSGNLHSAAKALERAAVEGGTHAVIKLSAEPADVLRADRVVLPGVGAFGDCKAGLEAIPGLLEALRARVQIDKRPFLGICVGMQLMAARGHEFVAREGLGWLDGDVVSIEPEDASLKIPHMGWNTLTLERAHPLLEGIETGPGGQHAYFVHSFHMRPSDGDDLVARTEYGGPVTAMVARGNVAGTQFHPEKSQRLGLRLLANFLSWSPDTG